MKYIIMALSIVFMNSAHAQIDIGSLSADIRAKSRGLEIVVDDGNKLIVETSCYGIPAQIGYYFSNDRVDEVVCAFHVNNQDLGRVLGVYDRAMNGLIKGKPEVDVKIEGIRLTRSLDVTTAIAGDYILATGLYDEKHNCSLRVLLQHSKPNHIGVLEFGITITRFQNSTNQKPASQP